MPASDLKERPAFGIRYSAFAESREPKTEYGRERKRVDWHNTFWVGLMHLGVLFAPFTFSWGALGLCLLLHWICGGLGICLGYHRLLTHRSFRVPKWLEYLLTFFGTLSLQGGPMSWVAAHRLHHARSDAEGDPHSPQKSFFWGHMGWVLTRNPLLDHYDKYRRYVRDLEQDRFHHFIERYQALGPLLLAAALYALGGASYVVWGIFVRTTLVYHCTWLVNSASHLWGYKSFETNEGSTNNWWVALLGYGEGWHNNHHAFQISARHGLRWWELDATYLAIKILKALGLASDIRLPAPPSRA